MRNENFKNYVKYMGLLIKEQANKAKSDAQQPNEGWEDFNKGELMAYHTIISLLKVQAPIFDIKETEIGLDDIDPDTDLLSLQKGREE